MSADMMPSIITPNKPIAFVNLNWQVNPGIEILVVAQLEDDGGYSVFAPKLPGAASQGDTLDEAVTNIREAIQGVLASYAASGMPIPWRTIGTDEHPQGIERRIVVHV